METQRRTGRRLLLVATLAVVVIGLAAVGLRWAWSDGRLNDVICDGACGPEYVVAPAGVRAVPSGADEGPDAGVDDSADLEQVLAATRSDLGDRLLGDRVGLAVGSVADDEVVTAGDAGPFVPASTTKVLTGLAALSTIDPSTRYATRAVADGDRVVLVGGGDPYLTDRRADDDPDAVRATLRDLAVRTARSLKADGRTTISLGYDESLFSGPAINPAWESSYVPENVVTPISALWVDRGVQGNGVRTRTPAEAAAERFADLLDARGITVRGSAEAAPAPDGADVLGEVRSATLRQIVEQMVRTSDNEATEVVARQVALATDQPPTFAGGAAAIERAIADVGLDTAGLSLDDGSGLARSNRISPTTLVEAVRAAYAEPRTSGVVDDLPVSGFSGTLAVRFDGDARGMVRAKTGTLKGVHTLAGIAVDADGRPVVFAVMSDDSDPDQPFAAQAAVDDVASAIAQCSCG